MSVSEVLSITGPAPVIQHTPRRIETGKLMPARPQKKKSKDRSRFKPRVIKYTAQGGAASSQNFLVDDPDPVSFRLFFSKWNRFRLSTPRPPSSFVQDYSAQVLAATVRFIQHTKYHFLYTIDAYRRRAQLFSGATELLRVIMKKNTRAQVVETLLWAALDLYPAKVFTPQASPPTGGVPTWLKYTMFVLAIPFTPLALMATPKIVTDCIDGFIRRGGVGDKLDFMYGLFEWLKHLFYKGVECVQTGSLGPLFRSSSDYLQWYDDAKQHIAKEILVGIEGEHDLDSYLVQNEDLIDKGKIIVQDSEITVPLAREINRVINLLEEISTGEHIREVIRKSRCVPLALGLSGLPNIGKSTFIKKLYRVMALKKKQTYHPKFIFQQQSSDAFLSGLKNYHKVILFDDLGLMKEQVDPQGSTSGPKLFMELFNPTVAATNQADLKDKGKIYARAELVLVTSNSQDFGVSHILRTPSAFFRRLKYHVDLIVKDEWRVDKNVNCLDELRVKRLGATDVHLYTISQYVMKNDGYERETIISRADAPAFWNWYSTIIEHQIQSTTFNNEQDDLLQNAYMCETCGVISLDCVCVKVEPEDPLQDLLTTDFINDPAYREKTFEKIFGEHQKKKVDYGESRFDPQGGAPSKPRSRSSTLDTIDENSPTPPPSPKQRRSKPRLTWYENQLKTAAVDLINLGLRRENLWAITQLVGSRTWVMMKKHFLGIMSQILVVSLDCSIYKAPTKEETLSPFVETSVENHFIKERFREEKKKKDAGILPIFTPQSGTYAERLQAKSKGVPKDIYAKSDRLPDIVYGDAHRYVPLHVAAAKIAKNQVTLSFGFREKPTFIAGTGLVGDMILTVAHDYVLNKYVTVERGDQQLHYEITKDLVQALDIEKDILVFRCPAFEFTNILDYFPIAFNVLPSLSKVSVIHVEEQHSVAVTTLQPFSAKVGFGDTDMPVNQYYSPDVQTEGSCGGLAIAIISRRRPCVVAMHHLKVEVGTATGSLLIPLTLTEMGVNWEHFTHKISTPPRLLLRRNGLGYRNNLPVETDVDRFHRKAYTHWRKHWTPEFYPIAYINYGVLKPKTRLVPTIFHGKIQQSEKVIPDMRIGDVDGKYVNHYNEVVDQLADNRARYDPVLLANAERRVASSFTSVFKRHKIGKHEPLTEHQSLNGIDGVRFMDAIKRATGKGLPGRGPKTDVMYETDVGWKYSQKGRQSIAIVAKAAVGHYNPGVVCDVTLKDECKKVTKAVRGFSTTSFAFNDLLRRLVLPLFKILQENPILFGVCVGLNADSYEWRELNDAHMKRLFHIFYDFTKYDRSHSGPIMAAAFRIFMQLMSLMFKPEATIEGYPWYMVAAGLFAMVVYPVYNSQNVIFQAVGSLPSGVAITAVINTIIQILILEMLWEHFCNVTGQKENIPRFRFFNTWHGYGDDGMLSSDMRGFDLPFFAKTAATWLLKITSPDKSPILPSTFPHDQWEFLKRKFKETEHDGVRCVEAELAFQSVVKTMNYWEPDDTKEESEAMVERFNAAMLFLTSIDGPEADALIRQCRQVLSDTYGPTILQGVRSREDAMDVKREILKGPSHCNDFNFADVHGETRSSYAARVWNEIDSERPSPHP